MAGETNLGRILAGMGVGRRDGVYVYATVAPGEPLPDIPIAAVVSETEGTTIVLDRDVAVAAGIAWEFEAAWLSITVHTSLEAVGVTASVATALAMKGIPCNVLAGFHHDHLLVPIDRVDDAIAAVDLVRQQART